MSATELKKLLVKRIQSTDDIEILNALCVLTKDKIQSVRETRKKIKRTVRGIGVERIQEKTQKKHYPLKPMTLAELFARDAQSEKEMKEGKLISQEEIKRRFGITK